MTSERRSGPRAFAAMAILAALALGGCQGANQSRTIDLTTLNGSGVTGTVLLSDLGDGRTRVEVDVDDAGNLDMPAHIHPGTCAQLVPQPKYPLQNVRNGRSVTVVPASFGELETSTVAVNVHKSVADLKTYTACADL